MFTRRHQEPVRCARRNVNDVTRTERVTVTPFEPRADVLACCRAPPPDHRPPDDERPCPALHVDDVDDGAVFFGVAVGVPVEQTEPVIAVVGKRLA